MDKRHAVLDVKYCGTPDMTPMPIAHLTPKAMFRVYITTFLSAASAELVTFPLDVTKTRLHLQGEVAEKEVLGQRRKKRGMLKMMYGIAKEEGITSLYGGLRVMILRKAIFDGLRVVGYDILRKQMIYVDENGNEVLTIARSFAASNIAGCLSQAITNPLDIVKIRMQMEGRRRFLGKSSRVSGIAHTVVGIYRRGGLPNMWRGVTPSCMRAMLLTTGDTGSYDICKRRLRSVLKVDEGPMLQFLSSVSAGFVASVLSTPADVLKSRIMNQPTDRQGKGLHYRNTYDCFYKLVSQEGILAMYKGFMPCWMRIGPWSVVFWAVFEKLRKLQGESSF